MTARACRECGTDRMCLECSYVRTAEEERAAIVAWLRGGGLSAGRTSPDDPYVEAVAMVAADAIECGEHVPKAPVVGEPPTVPGTSGGTKS